MEPYKIVVYTESFQHLHGVTPGKHVSLSVLSVVKAILLALASSSMVQSSCNVCPRWFALVINGRYIGKTKLYTQIAIVNGMKLS
jgi:hypothetical protein